jgi:broad specificity phosphatase PhoE
VVLDVIVIQHAEKIAVAGDHGLTEHGRLQAQEVGQRLAAHGGYDELWSSPLVRARRTARILADEVQLSDTEVHQDARLTERVNWWNEAEVSRDAFVADWVRSTRDRDYTPAGGDSSRAAGDRFAAFLGDLYRRLPEGRVLIVSHGGVTIDLVRTWFGDERVEAFAIGAIEHGIPPCALTWITLSGDGRTLHMLGTDALIGLPYRPSI